MISVKLIQWCQATTVMENKNSQKKLFYIANTGNIRSVLALFCFKAGGETLKINKVDDNPMVKMGKKPLSEDITCLGIFA